MKRIYFIASVVLFLLPFSMTAQFMQDTVSVTRPSAVDNAIAQNDSIKAIDRFSQLTAADLISLEIPPLSVLLENAKHSPVTSALLAQVEQRQEGLKIQKKEWLQNFRV
ncbi:MAG: hypothetical protein PHD07_05295, partial [Bacteroidales bacterium]|nr:hypothetical protein [Bacteroidales bacterium]